MTNNTGGGEPPPALIMKKFILSFLTIGFLLSCISDILLRNKIAYQIPFILNPYTYIHLATYGYDSILIILYDVLAYAINISVYTLFGYLIAVGNRFHQFKYFFVALFVVYQIVVVSIFWH